MAFIRCTIRCSPRVPRPTFGPVQVSSKSVGGPAKPHVLLVSRSAAPRAASLPRASPVRPSVRSRGGARWHRHAPCCGSRAREPRRGAFNSPEAEKEVRCGRRVQRTPAVLFVFTVNNSPAAAAPLTPLFASFNGPAPRKSLGLCEHHARCEMPAVRCSVCTVLRDRYRFSFTSRFSLLQATCD